MFRNPAHALATVFYAGCLALLLASCATHAELRRGMVDQVRAGEYERAQGQQEKLVKDSSKKDRVMDLMDRGMLLHLRGDYAASNRALTAAADEIDRLFGVSVSDELAALAWNEASRAFVGEEFERIMVHLIMAFNYLHLNKLEDAAVEARIINQKLQVYTDRLAKNNVKTAYKQDPFAQFLAGLIHEAFGDLNAAFRSYEDAYQGYLTLKNVTNVTPPNSLTASLLRSARSLGYAEAIEKYEPLFSNQPLSEPQAWQNKGRLVVIAGLGEVAHKRSKKWRIPDIQGDIVAVTYPEFERGSFFAKKAEVTVSGVRTDMTRAQDLSTLAIRELDSKNAQVKGRAVAKALASYAVKKAAKIAYYKSDNQAVKAVSLLANIAMNVKDFVEEADTRSWMTLPDHYRIAVIPVKPGLHKVTVHIEGHGGLVDTQSFQLDIPSGETRFLVVRGREGANPDDPAQPLPETASKGRRVSSRLRQPAAAYRTEYDLPWEARYTCISCE